MAKQQQQQLSQLPGPVDSWLQAVALSPLIPELGSEDQSRHQREGSTEQVPVAQQQLPWQLLGVQLAQMAGRAA